MFFTQEDYKNIEKYLKLNSMKDTDFQEAEDVFDIDKIAIVLEGFNKIVPIYKLGIEIYREMPKGFITPEKLNESVIDEVILPLIDDATEDLQHLIDALDAHGVAVSNHFGDDEYIGISQDTLTKAILDIQECINNLHPGTIGISLTANKSVVYKDATNNVTVTATMVNNKNAETIILKEGSTVIKEGTGVSTLSHQLVVSDTTSFTVDAVQNGLFYSQSLTVSAAYPVYVGAGATYTSVVTDASCKQTPRLTPKGTYTVTVGTTGHRIFFVVPSTMTINKATLSGFDFPLEMETATIGGVAYKVYKSNTLEAGTLTIVIS